MAEFRKATYKVQENHSSLDLEVTPLNLDYEPHVTDYRLPNLEEKGKKDYQEVRKKLGPLASTDSGARSKNQKDQRFSLNPLVRDPLAVEKEEQRVIDERVREGIEKVTASARETAKKQGYEEGLKQGHQAAFEKLQEQSHATLSRFDEFLKHAERAKEEIFQANEKFLIELIYRIAKMVLLKELEVDQGRLIRLAKELINRVGVRDNIKILINPDDAQTISLLREGIEKDVGKMRNLNVETSPTVEKGGIQVETEWNAISVTIEEELRGIYESIFGSAALEEQK